MQVVPMTSANAVFQDFVAVATASTTNGSNGPANAIDNNGATFWDSNSGDVQPGGGPWLQIDLTRILKVYGVVVIFDSNTNRPQPNFLIETSDSPTDRAYGTWSGSGAFDLIGNYPAPSGSVGRYGEFTAFIPTTSAGQYGVATTQSTGSFKTVDTRYIRIQSPNSSVPLRIVDVQVWASNTKANTTSRVRIGGYSPAAGIWSGGTLFSPTFSNDLLDIDVLQMMGRQVWSGTVILNNGGQKYSRARFPEGTPVKVWIDGTTELLGTITNFDPKYSLRGLTANIDIRGYDDFLNQEMRYAWAATPISDKTAPADIISTGPNSILGQTTNSVGARVIGNLNVQNAVIGANNLIYYPAKDTPKLTVLNDLAETTIDGAWVLQNTNFSPTLTTYGTTLGRSGAGVSDGYWFGIKTRPGYQIDLRTPAQANSIELFAQGGTTNVAESNPTFTWDGNIGNDPLYNYIEVFQSVFFPISATSAAGSFTFTATLGARTVKTSGGGGSDWAVPDQVDEIMVEAVDKIGRIKRLHYYIGGAIHHQGTGSSCLSNTSALFNFNGANVVFPPPDTDSDKYILVGPNPGADTCNFGSGYTTPNAQSRNLYTDWTTRYTNGIDSGGSDVVTVIRIRQYPFVHPVLSNEPNNFINNILWSNVAITPVAHVKTPPVRYEFYVHESSVGSQVPDLYFFPHPRPNIDLSYRNLDGSTNARWYTTQNTSPTNSLGSDFNNIETFDFMKGDVYRVKNDTTTIGGQEIQLTDKANIDTTNPYYQLRVPSKSTHASRQEQIQLADMASITSIGRRQKFFSLTQTDPVELTREAVKVAYQNRSTESRGTIKIRGNAAYQPGYILTVESDYSELAGKYLLYQVQHKWNQNGYVCTLNVEDIDFLMTNEFSRAQINILQAAGRGGRGATGNLKTDTQTKVNTDITGTRYKNITGDTVVSNSMDYNQASLPLNVISENANIKFVTITIQKAFGGENIGDVGVFGPEGGSGISQATYNTRGGPSPSPDNAGWYDLGALQTQASAGVHEQNVTDTNYVAQRFRTSSVLSAGSFLFMFNGRLPTGVTQIGNSVLFSIWDDASSGIGGHPQPGKPLVGSQDVGSGFGFVTGNAFTSLGQFTYGLNKNIVQGWVAVPFDKITKVGADSKQDNAHIDNAFAVEVGLPTPAPPGTWLWLVMRVNSGGQNFYPMYTDIGAGQTTSEMGTISTDAGQTWGALGGGVNPFTQYSLSSNPTATFRTWCTAPMNSFGAWQATGTNTAHQPGTVGVTSAAQGTSMSPPVITDRNGSRMDVTNATKLASGTTMYVVEPTTGDRFVAVSTPSQETTIAQCSFPTSFVAKRDKWGDVFVALPLSGGSTFRRMTYTLACDFTDF